MSIESPRRQLHQLIEQSGGQVLNLSTANQVLGQVQEPSALFNLAAYLQNHSFHLVTVVANDERELEDHCFKLYYLFSHPDLDLFFTIEYLLPPGAETYPSIYPHFSAVDPFEREIQAMFGLCPQGQRQNAVRSDSWLTTAFPLDLYPLRRDQTTAKLKQKMEDYHQAGPHREARLDKLQLGDGEVFVVVGPIHKDIIESARFVFKTAGEIIEDVLLCLGYTHKGIERIFQAKLTLREGWKLAEQVSGDSSFAHSLAYCRAVESLAGLEPPQPAQMLRGLFLELERIYNHVGDIAALAHDVAREVIASDLAVIREELLTLNATVSGSRFLRGLNRPGGLILPQPLETAEISATLTGCLLQFNTLADSLAGDSKFRDRLINTGVLIGPMALQLGVTGLVARASGLKRDYRRAHPSGVYREAWVQTELDRSGSEFSPLSLEEAHTGDTYARFLTRYQEVQTAAKIIHQILDRWETHPHRSGTEFLAEVQFNPADNFTFAVGYAEGWRGEVVYWLMQDKLGHIYRCKVRDPSLLNWPALRHAVIPHEIKGKPQETLLVDFPLINKSFNLSGSGNDL
jgi:Ni,Fe-hydrogenase III large subunit/Ni,Fe-hydrogenase III component G